MREMLTTVPATLKSEPPGGDSTGIKGLASEVYLSLDRMISEHLKQNQCRGIITKLEETSYINTEFFLHALINKIRLALLLNCGTYLQ